jgi:hypothetical protein
MPWPSCRFRLKHATIVLLGAAVFFLLLGPLQRYWPYTPVRAFQVDASGWTLHTPDGTTLVSVNPGLTSPVGHPSPSYRMSGPLRVIDSATGAERGQLLDRGAKIQSLTYSPDSRLLLVDEQRALLHSAARIAARGRLDDADGVLLGPAAETRDRNALALRGAAGAVRDGLRLVAAARVGWDVAFAFAS